MKRIVSRANPQFKAIRELVNSVKERRAQQRAVLDGAHLVGSYIERRGAPLLIALSAGARADGEIEGLIARAGYCELLELPPALFAQLAPVETPSGILAVIAIPRLAPRVGCGQCVVMLAGVQDPGNVGTIIRSAAAAGADEVQIDAACADAWSPRTLRAAMGAHFALDVRTGVDLQAAAERFPGKVIATVARQGISPQALDLRGQIALLFGNEGSGLEEGLVRRANERIAIPMARGIESLNVGAAAAIVLFERVRQLSVGNTRQVH
ncbi:MAG: RNA methyltransferase [Burkholderiales bacterium]|nr:RNA methyltransferase [Burkholderiales bacterium]